MREAYKEKYSAEILTDEAFLHSLVPSEMLPVEIIDHDRLKYDTNSITISAAVLALNGLLRCRKDLAKAPEIRDAAGYDYAYSTFTSDMALLNEYLVELTALDPSVITEGRSTGKSYQLSPKLDFIDRRAEAPDHPDLKRYYYGLTVDPPTLSDYTGERIEFYSNQDRKRLISALLREASSEPSVRWLGTELTQSSNLRLDNETRRTDFALLERGIVAFIQPGQRSKEERQAIIDGAMAFQELFFSTLKTIQYLAGKMGDPTKGRLNDDIFQAGAIAVMEYIMTFDEAEADEDDKGMFFIHKMMKTAAGAMQHHLDADKWRQLGVSERGFRLIRQILTAQDELCGVLGREPSPAEIAEHLAVPLENVERYLYIMNQKICGFDQYEDNQTDFGLSKFLLKNNHVAVNDQELEALTARQQTYKLFLSDKLTTQQKLGLSVFYGIFIPELAGQAFLRKTRQDNSPFIYPDNEMDFLEIARPCFNSPLHTGRALNMDRSNVSKLIKDALVTCRSILKNTDER